MLLREQMYSILDNLGKSLENYSISKNKFQTFRPQSQGKRISFSFQTYLQANEKTIDYYRVVTNDIQ